MSWLARLLGRRHGATTPWQDSDANFERLVWLEPHQNPFGVRLLDCRPVAETFLSATGNPEVISFFCSSEAQSGERFRGQHLEGAIRFACELEYPLTTPLPDGPVFLASEMEDKWNIYHFDGTLYFVRSWTGHLQFIARLSLGQSELRVVEVEVWPGNVAGIETILVRQVDFLIRSHMLGQVAPHPTPFLPTKKDIATWSFSQYGRRGHFAEIESARAPSRSEAQA